MLIALLKQPAFDAKSIRSLPAVSIGDTINLPNLIAAAKDSKLLGVSKVTVELGMSEAMPICGFNGALEGMRVERGAVGVGNALSGVKVRICRDGSRKILARGETGELHTSGGMVIGEYIYGDNKPFYDDDEGHWITTGDRAVMDNDGSISIHQPYEDIIVRGGENLSVARIESCLREAGMVVRLQAFLYTIENTDIRSSVRLLVYLTKLLARSLLLLCSWLSNLKFQRAKSIT